MPGAKLRFDDKICLDPEEIVSEWGCYFRKLYSGSESPYFDPVFRRDIEHKMGRITEELLVSCVQDNMYVTAEDVRKAVKQLKCKKACGFDGIFNEHLINGDL